MVMLWPIGISVASFIYSGALTVYHCHPRDLHSHPALSIRAFLETRRQFAQVLSSSHSGLNMSRYFRLMALAATELCLSLPLSILILCKDLQSPQTPWVSWGYAHQDFHTIPTIPWVIIEALPDVRLAMDINRWVTPGGGFLFFIYFGLAGETSMEYFKVLWRFLKPLGINPPASRAGEQSSAW